MAVKVTRSFTATVRGIGKPDYSREISIGRERPGLTLKYNQALKSFRISFTPIASPYPYVILPLAPGASAHIIDTETGIEMPFTVQEGYTLAAISASFSFSQDMEAWLYMDGFLTDNFGLPVGGNVFYEAQIVGIGTALIDPTGAASHTFDIVVTNLGAANLEGGGSVFAILEMVGTPSLPDTKIVKCKFCGYEETLPRETTTWICPKCGKLNIYFDLSRFRGTP